MTPDPVAHGPVMTITAQPVKSPDFKIVYSNATRMGAGPYDIQIMFGSIRERTGPDDQVVEEQVMVMMSPQHAKAMLNSLRITVETYESNFGSIPDAAAAAATAVAKKTT